MFDFRFLACRGVTLRCGTEDCCPGTMAEKRFHEMLLFLSTLQQSTSEEQQKAGSLASIHEKMLQGCLADLSCGPAISMVAATDMLSKVAAAGLPQQMQERLVTAIQEKVATPDTEQQQDQKERAKEKACNQSCGTFYHYLTEQEWSVLMGEAEWAEKQRVVTNRCALLRLTNPTEPTSLLLLALLCVCSHKGPIQTLTIAPKQWLKMLDDLKTAIRSRSKRLEHSGLKSYPLDPKSLPAKLYEHAYPLQGPEPCKTSVDAILSLTDALPARRNHGSVAPKCHGLLAKDHSLHETFGAMTAAMQQLQSFAALGNLSSLGGSTNSGALPGLTYFKPRKPKALSAASEPQTPEADAEALQFQQLALPGPANAEGQQLQQLALPGPSQKAAEASSGLSARQSDEKVLEDTCGQMDAAEQVQDMQAAVLKHLGQKGRGETQTPKRNTAFFIIGYLCFTLNRVERRLPKHRLLKTRAS